MPLIKVPEIIQSLKEKDKTLGCLENLNCWESKEINYSLYIFSIQLTSQDELLTIHEDLRDFIAIYFQSQSLDKNVERWNIYQFFFIQDKLDDHIKQKIEQDKFSTRKIIHDDQKKELSDDIIEDLINQELFDFKIEKREIKKDSIISFLKNDHSSVLSLINELDPDKLNESIEQILTSLGYE